MQRRHTEVHTDTVTLEQHEIEAAIAQAAMNSNLGFIPLAGSTVTVQLKQTDNTTAFGVTAVVTVIGSPQGTDFGS